MEHCDLAADLFTTPIKADPTPDMEEGENEADESSETNHEQESDIDSETVEQSLNLYTCIIWKDGRFTIKVNVDLNAYMNCDFYIYLKHHTGIILLVILLCCHIKYLVACM